jgi:predicted amidohydrolase
LTDFSTSTFRLAVSQSAPRLGDVAGNLEHIIALARAHSADLLVTPELSLTGYDVRDAVHMLAQPANGLPQLANWPTRPACLIGFIEAGSDGIPYNTSAVVRGQDVLFTQRKVYLPTYGMFDEGRWFGRGRHIRTFMLNGWRVGILICEDFWHPALTYLLACQGIELLIVQAAAPGRGAWAGGENGDFASNDVWERMARTTAQQYGIYVALCNRVGVEGGVTFGGGSVVVEPNGEIARALYGEQTTVLELDIDHLLRARRPYAHSRDESMEFTLRELQRIVKG